MPTGGSEMQQWLKRALQDKLVKHHILTVGGWPLHATFIPPKLAPYLIVQEDRLPAQQ